MAAQLHGLVRRSDLVSLGATETEIQRRLGAGRLELVQRGVYYLDCVPATWKSQVLAAVMAAGPDALASHRTAGLLWGFDAVYGRIIELTVPFNEEPEPEGAVVHRTRRPNAVEVLNGIPITSPEKTILDLASILGDKALSKAARSAIRLGLSTPEKMDQVVAMYGGRGVKGTRRTRRVIRMVADDHSGSVAELDLKDIILDAPVPAPIQQLRVRLPDGSNAYPDFSWPDRIRIIEVDGFGAHGSPEQFEKDLRRQNALMDLGWEIRRFTATEIREDPRRVRDEVVRFVNKPFCAGLTVEETFNPAQNGWDGWGTQTR